MPATIWICLVEGPSGEQRIRAWTPDADRAEAFRKEGLEMQQFSVIPQSEVQSTPVSYRWRQPGNKHWIYDPTPAWIEDHKHEIELEALYLDAAQAEVQTDEALAEEIHRIAGCQVGSERCKNIIKWYRSKSVGAAQEAKHCGALASFFKWAMREGAWEGCDLDGGGIQDKAESLGLIVKTKFDPATHSNPHGDYADGDDYYEFAPGLSVPSASRETGK